MPIISIIVFHIKPPKNKKERKSPETLYHILLELFIIELNDFR